ncbi:hypothetical protein DITRI_Ditri11bG0011200 [Diplodiscus trichospermus]
MHMGSSSKRAGLQCIATLMMAMIFLFNYHASAFSATTSNSSGSHCSGFKEECLIVDDADLVFFADPETSLGGKPLKITPGSGKKGGPVITCGRGKPYNPCVPDPNKPKKGENCGPIYKDNNKNRACR